MLDVMKAPMGKEEEEREGDDEFGMSLELSIGGSYGKTDGNSKGETCEREADRGGRGGEYYKSEENGSSSCFAGSEENCSVINAMDLQRRREMQALRRQEARKKREEKLLLKKSRGLGFVVDDNCKLLLSLEAQQVQARAVDRDQGFSKERARKKDKISDLNLSLCSGEDDDKKIEGQSECLYPQVQQFVAGCGNGSFGCPWPWKGNVGCSSLRGSTSADYCDDSELSNGGTVNGRGNLKAGSNGSLEQCSSAVFDYQSTSHKGGSTSDVGSNSHLEGNGSSSPTQLDNKVAPLSISQSSRTRLPQESKTGGYPDQIANSNSPATKNRASPPSKEMNGGGGGGPVDQPPKPPNQNLKAASSVPHMPCVTTTGNGPNGRTVTGFLYKYSKTEVSIMCVCHGSSFSPAEFVEHAGGADVSNPLRHITVVPSPMAFR